MTAKTNIFRRGLFTDLLYAELVTRLGNAPLALLGDGEAPTAGGWSGQQAGAGNFVPYVVLATSGTAENFADPLRGQDKSWRLTYTLRGVGANRQQADFAADQLTVPASTLTTKTFPVGVNNALWKVLKSKYTSLGSVNRNDATDPPLWERVDTLEIWLDLGP